MSKIYYYVLHSVDEIDKCFKPTGMRLSLEKVQTAAKIITLHGTPVTSGTGLRESTRDQLVSMFGKNRVIDAETILMAEVEE